jgi:hypothetical protein
MPYGRYLSIWPITFIVISNRFNSNTKPHVYKKWGLIISPWKPFGYRVSLSRPLGYLSAKKYISLMRTVAFRHPTSRILALRYRNFYEFKTTIETLKVNPILLRINYPFKLGINEGIKGRILGLSFCSLCRVFFGYLLCGTRLS